MNSEAKKGRPTTVAMTADMRDWLRDEAARRQLQDGKTRSIAQVLDEIVSEWKGMKAELEDLRATGRVK